MQVTVTGPDGSSEVIPVPLDGSVASMTNAACAALDLPQCDLFLDSEALDPADPISATPLSDGDVLRAVVDPVAVSRAALAKEGIVGAAEPDASTLLTLKAREGCQLAVMLPHLARVYPEARLLNIALQALHGDTDLPDLVALLLHEGCSVGNFIPPYYLSVSAPPLPDGRDSSEQPLGVFLSTRGMSATRRDKGAEALCTAGAVFAPDMRSPEGDTAILGATKSRNVGLLSVLLKVAKAQWPPEVVEEHHSEACLAAARAPVKKNVRDLHIVLHELVVRVPPSDELLRRILAAVIATHKAHVLDGLDVALNLKGRSGVMSSAMRAAEKYPLKLAKLCEWDL